MSGRTENPVEKCRRNSIGSCKAATSEFSQFSKVKMVTYGNRPLKKRKMNDLNSKIDRVVKKVGRLSPEKCFYENVYTFTRTHTATGFQNDSIDLLPTALLDDVNGDFIVESIEYRVYPVNHTNVDEFRADIIVPQDGNEDPYNAYGTVQSFDNPKGFKSYHSKSGLGRSDAQPRRSLEGVARTKLVAKHSVGGNSVTRNGHWFLLRWNQTTTTDPDFRVGIRVTYRIK